MPSAGKPRSWLALLAPPAPLALLAAIGGGAAPRDAERERGGQREMERCRETEPDGERERKRESGGRERKRGR